MRVRLEKQPEWDERFRGWSAKFIAKNMWRCEGHDPQEKFKDLIQDAYLMFRHILASYPEVSDPKHIMALFQRAMINDYNDRARFKQRKTSIEIPYETTIGKDLKLIDKLGEFSNEGFLRVLLGQLPDKVKLTIEALQDQGKLAYLCKHRAVTVADFSGKRELTNSTLCQIIGLPKRTNLLEMICSALLADEEDMSNTVHPIEQELLAATQFVPEKKYRKRQTYLTALMRAVDSLKDDEFEKLSDKAAKWVDRAVEAFKKGNDLPDLTDSPTSNGETEGVVEVEFAEVTNETALEWETIENTSPVNVVSEVEHDVPQKKARKPRKAKAEKAESPQKPRIASANRGVNEWGVANGTKAAQVCELISRPGGSTMQEIKELTGQTQYNVVNRLQRKGADHSPPFGVTKEGLVIKLNWIHPNHP